MLAGPRPVAAADLSRVTQLFTDVDGTLTTRGKLQASTVEALEALREGGFGVVMVTGRPAGWGEAFARTMPVDAVLCENGALYWAWRKGRLHKIYAQPSAARARNRLRLHREVG